MARQIAISFENELVRVVYASVRPGHITIQKTLTLREEAFDAFLKEEKTGPFTVVCDFNVFYQDVLLLPPVKDKYLNNIVETEMKKKFPDLGEFSFFYAVLGETSTEGRKAREVFIFAVNNEDLFQIIERFGKHGKTVTQLYPSPFVLARFAKLSGTLSEEPVLCVGGAGTIKTLFLMKNRELYFVRVVQSSGTGMHGPDIQNINMTASYCRQTMKINPLRIILLGAASLGYEATMDMIAPVVSADSLPDIVTSEEDTAEYMVPITALLPDSEMKKGSIVPRDYRAMLMQKAILTWCLMFFVVCSVFGLGYIKLRLSDLASLKSGTGYLASEIKALGPVRRAYETRNAEMQKLMPLLDLAKSATVSPDAQKALMALQGLHMDKVNVRSIEINAAENVLNLHVRGTITAPDYAVMQKVYQNLIDALRNTPGIEVASQKIDLKDKSFQIEARYR